MTKPLIAYFSASGVTEKVARRLASVTGGDLYKIEPAVPYSEADLDWRDPKSRSSVEMSEKCSRPALAPKALNLEPYEKVYLGFPIWWYIAPTLINSFLEQYDFSGKTIIPFATSGGSGVGETDRWLRSSCSPETKWLPAVRLEAGLSEGGLKRWLDSLNK